METHFSHMKKVYWVAITTYLLTRITTYVSVDYDLHVS